MNRLATAVTITDPLVKYQALVATGVCTPDAAQHRLAHHLQKLYTRLKDYTPAQEYRTRLDQVTQALDSAKKADDDHGDRLATRNHPIRTNPLFARFFQKPESRDTLALTRVLTSHQAALHVDSPKGLFLSGEVGTGKSMLLDLLAEGLPTQGKKRWHFNTFMLHALSRLEQFRRSRAGMPADPEEYSLLWIAKEMVEKSPILFLDEFQLPDRAASKIMNNLFIAFFQLGGVLIASSNRMPEELEKATGGHYPPPATGGLFEQVLGLRRRRGAGELFGQTSDFAAFLEVLKARCDFWHMEGARDWRRRETQAPTLHVAERLTNSDSSLHSRVGDWSQETSGSGMNPGAPSIQDSLQDGSQRPAMYLLPFDESERWTAAVQRVVGDTYTDLSLHIWKPSSVIVYGRRVTVPRQYNGIAYWDFSELVSSLGPADYITLASNFHTFVIDNVPILSYAMKNEARRFITLLDALYESRCKLIIRAEAGPDDLFFPETRQRPSTGDGQAVAGDQEVVVGDATYSETIAEVFQDQMSPFRPNISSYTETLPNSKYDPDQDSDFGREQEQKKIDFTKTGAFTGEDERFAYKRATSRLWEMCSSQWHSRSGDGWWQPLPSEARHWESTEPSKPLPPHVMGSTSSEITLGPSTEVEEPAGLERFRIASLRKGE